MLFKKKGCILFALIWLSCFFSPSVNAQDSKKLSYRTIKTSELKAIWDSKAKDFLVVDTRNPEEYNDVHIPGAVNIPQNKFAAYKHLLPAEKSTRLIFYCNGIK